MTSFANGLEIGPTIKQIQIALVRRDVIDNACQSAAETTGEDVIKKNLIAKKMPSLLLIEVLPCG
ncbi:MAG: hypothetical protein ACK5XN_37600 [Bacteroidota bacterium]